jgi:myo-inositol-1(or 4)-monophosphatase
LNGKSMRVSGCQHMDQAMIASSFSAKVQRDSEEIRQFIEVSVECQSLRRTGSAALNLCYVGASRLDAYWATSAKCWDVAAGALIVREAGGIVTSADGGAFQLQRPRLAAASTEVLHHRLVELLRRGT